MLDLFRMLKNVIIEDEAPDIWDPETGDLESSELRRIAVVEGWAETEDDPDLDRAMAAVFAWLETERGYRERRLEECDRRIDDRGRVF